MKKSVQVDGNMYEVVKEYRDGFREEDFQEKYTDFFENFDYIFGDYSYDKLRLKGFYEKDHKNAKKMNTIEGLENYIESFCSYECRYFLLKKIKN